MTRPPMLVLLNALVLVVFVGCAEYQEVYDPPDFGSTATDNRIAAMLVGGLVGDAAGGPVEFVDPSRWDEPGVPFKRWSPGERFPTTEDGLDAYGSALQLMPYAVFRPEPEPYAHWRNDAPPGTLTDDTRHKLVVIDAIRRSKAPPTEGELARAYLRAADDWTEFADTALVEDNLREYLYAARWVVGERDPSRALPPTRIWAALPTCAGQMALPPLAGLAPGNPDAAYRFAHDAAFFDTGPAKDTNAAFVAGLAFALTLEAPSPGGRRAAWQQVKSVMRECDPYRYDDVPWTTRPIHRVLDTAERLAEESQGEPAALIAAIEGLTPPIRDRAWWESDIILIMAFAAIELADAHPTASMRLAIELGYDTDSTAQAVGLVLGAMNGLSVFPRALRDPPRQTLRSDYNADVDEWTELLHQVREPG
ncbi:MAG: ADP-ribosylglycohydrolase family protein [Planctomycetota bacterium]